MASMALPVARERHAKNVWHIALRRGYGEFLNFYNSQAYSTKAYDYWFFIT